MDGSASIGVVRRTAVDGRTTRHAGYRASQICRKRIEEVFGWIKAQAGLARVKARGCTRAEAAFTFAVAPYNLIRMPNSWRNAQLEDARATQAAQPEPFDLRTPKAKNLNALQTRDFFSSQLERKPP
jgi:hypothetical protein